MGKRKTMELTFQSYHPKLRALPLTGGDYGRTISVALPIVVAMVVSVLCDKPPGPTRTGADAGECSQHTMMTGGECAQAREGSLRDFALIGEAAARRPTFHQNLVAGVAR